MNLYVKRIHQNTFDAGKMFIQSKFNLYHENNHSHVISVKWIAWQEKFWNLCKSRLPDDKIGLGSHALILEKEEVQKLSFSCTPTKERKMKTLEFDKYDQDKFLNF